MGTLNLDGKGSNLGCTRIGSSGQCRFFQVATMSCKDTHSGGLQSTMNSILLRTQRPQAGFLALPRIFLDAEIY